MLLGVEGVPLPRGMKLIMSVPPRAGTYGWRSLTLLYTCALHCTPSRVHRYGLYFRSKRAKREVYKLDPPLLGPQPRILGRSI
jgi:hypothetical protein